MTFFFIYININYYTLHITVGDLRMENPCDMLYGGSRQLSEPETVSFTKYMEGIKSHKIDIFIAIKEGDVLVSIIKAL